MPQHRSYSRTFFSAPLSITSLVAAVLEPVLIVAVFLAVSMAHGLKLEAYGLTLCLVVLAITFPGQNRFADRPLNAAVDICVAWITVLAILFFCAYATGALNLFSISVLIWWAVLTPMVQWVAVFMGRKLLRHLASLPKNRRRAVIVGAGPLGIKVARAFQAHGFAGVRLLGYFDDRHDHRVDAEAQPLHLGRLNELAAFIRCSAVDDVYITLPLGSQPRINALLEQLQATTASVFFVPDVFGISIIQGRLLDMNGVPMVGICETPFTGANQLAKRLSDVVLASAIMTVLSPVMLVIAIGVRLSSPGPIIFKQRRNGLAGEEIEVWKFRSMTTQDNGIDVRQATQGDPRITPFGAFIRKTSLDELPQFFNVLQGSMSIVGPRPHAVAHNEQYRDLIKAYMVRHKVKPGITGWAQVNGLRGETKTVERMSARLEYDLEYLRNWSLTLDLQIIARTVKLVFFDKNAY